MPVIDAFGAAKKNDVMKDTWGHMYPEPKSKHTGFMILAIGEYGDEILIQTEFPTLPHSSPQRYHLEHTAFNLYEPLDIGVYRLDCTMWFFKDCEDMYISSGIGKIIKPSICKLNHIQPTIYYRSNQ